MVLVDPPAWGLGLLEEQVLVHKSQLIKKVKTKEQKRGNLVYQVKHLKLSNNMMLILVNT